MTAVKHQVGTPAKKVARPAAAAAPVDVEVPEDDTQESGFNLLHELQSELSGQAQIPPITLTVPNRPNIELVFDPNFEFEVYQAWNRRCENKKTKETDFAQLSVIVISNTNSGLLLKGQTVETDGEPWTIARPEVHKFLGSPIGGTAAAIRKMYGSDGHMIQAARQIIERAGYSLEGDVVEGGPLED